MGAIGFKWNLSFTRFLEGNTLIQFSKLMAILSGINLTIDNRDDINWFLKNDSIFMEHVRTGFIDTSRRSLFERFLLAFFWFIWRERNARCFNDKVCSNYAIFDSVFNLMLMWVRLPKRKADVGNDDVNCNLLEIVGWRVAVRKRIMIADV